MISGHRVSWLEGEKTFVSIKEASVSLNISYNKLYYNLANKGIFKSDGVTLTWERMSLADDEVFRNIPEYEGKYQISNKGNVYSVRGKKLLSPGYHKKTRKHVVILYANGLPTCFTINVLMQRTWPEMLEYKSKKPSSTFHSNTNKSVYCLEMSQDFSSIMNCCKDFNFDYQEFRKYARKRNSNGIFQYKGLTFKI